MEFKYDDYKETGISLLSKLISYASVLEEYNPNILVITGHDAYLKEKRNNKENNEYKNSNYFINAVKKARIYESSKDSLIIFVYNLFIVTILPSHQSLLLHTIMNYFEKDYYCLHLMLFVVQY